MSIDTHDHFRARGRRRLRAALAGLAAVAIAVTLAACGGSSSTASSATNSANTTTQANGQRSSRFAALRACLEKEGIKLPSAPSRRSPQSGGGGLLGGGGGGFNPPAGVSQSEFQKALKKCGAGFPGGARRFNSATGRAALTKFAQCMRENGVNLPPPNTSGNGPVFNTKGINTSSSTFKAAQSKCRSDLRGAFGGRGGPPGGGPPGGASAAPPAEGGGAPPGSEGGA